MSRGSKRADPAGVDVSPDGDRGPQEETGDEAAAAPAGPGDHSGGTRRRLAWIVAGVLMAALVALVVTFALRGGSRTPAASPSTPARPTLSPQARVPFEFRLTRVKQTSYTGKESARAARRAAGLVRILLSRWYDAAFFDPAEWTAGLPPRAWAPFASSVVGRARKDAAALTLGKVEGLEELAPTRTRLFVRVLLDPSRRAIAAIATVSLDAQGTLGGRDLLRVTNDARFLLRVVGGRWTIVGYPEARTTEKQVPAPPPTPAPGPSGSASLSPSASASA